MPKTNQNQKNISDLISDPGCFILFDIASRKDSKNTFKKNDKEIALCIDKDRKEEAKKVYNSYACAFNNSLDLILEADLLFNNGYYARALALAIMSYEEIGKSQIAADYYSGVLRRKDYEKAFVSHHEKSSFAGRYKAIGKNNSKSPLVSDLGFVIDKDSSREIEKIRQNCFYVDEENDPSKNFDKKEVERVLRKVCQHIRAIEHAEQLNGRIGSKALFK
ncbi:MAG: AbiV family abortive infection protein [Candidatus Paceibacterota bacterium]